MCTLCGLQTRAGVRRTVWRAEGKLVGCSAERFSPRVSERLVALCIDGEWRVYRICDVTLGVTGVDANRCVLLRWNG